MGSLVQIRDVPDDVRRALKARAAAAGESLNSYLLKLLGTDAARPTAREVFERAAQRGAGVPFSAVEALEESRRDRDEQLSGPSV